jgi:hypothetical protein
MLKRLTIKSKEYMQEFNFERTACQFSMKRT